MKGISQLFIDHPRAAWVVAIVIALCGAICLSRMAVAEYPQITPVTITVSCTYTGAGAQDLSDSVAQILEDQINSVARRRTPLRIAPFWVSTRNPSPSISAVGPSPGSCWRLRPC